MKAALTTVKWRKQRERAEARGKEFHHRPAVPPRAFKAVTLYAGQWKERTASPHRPQSLDREVLELDHGLHAPDAKAECHGRGWLVTDWGFSLPQATPFE